MKCSTSVFLFPFLLGSTLLWHILNCCCIIFSKKLELSMSFPTWILHILSAPGFPFSHDC